MAIRSRVGCIKQFHGSEIDFSALEDQSDPVVQSQVLVKSGSQTFVDKGINPVVLLAQDPGMVRLG